MKKIITFNGITQVCLVLFTSSGFLLTSLKLPQYGVLSSIIAQFFWLYSSYRAWRKAEQVGIFVNAIINTVFIAIGVYTYWIR